MSMYVESCVYFHTKCLFWELNIFNIGYYFKIRLNGDKSKQLSIVNDQCLDK